MRGVGITIDKITKSFDGDKGAKTLALADTSLDIKAGEFVTIVGASGCGKSTLLRLIAGLEYPSSGGLYADGAPIEGPSVQRAMVFQNYSLFPWLNVIRNVTFSRRLEANRHDLMASGRDMERDRAEELLRLVGLSAVRDALPAQLSGGMRQRVAIARALMSSPAVLLMDEPFGALDALTREVMQDLILDVYDKERATIVFVTHDVEEAVFLGGRVVVMAPRPGRIADIFDCPFGSRRPSELRMQLDFLNLKRTVVDRVRETAAFQPQELV